MPLHLLSVRSCARLAFFLVLAPFAGALAGCGAATPSATTPAHAEVEVVVPKGEPTPSGERTKGEEGEMGERLSAVGTLTDLDDSVLQQLMKDAESGGVVGGVLSGSGVSGLGLSGSGIGGGGGIGGLIGRGSGGGGVAGGTMGGSIGLGGLGTIGRGSGTGSGYGISGSGYRSDPVPGTSINVGARSVIELGDSATVGVSVEQATRALRGQVQKLRECYEDKGLDVSAQAAGGMVLRLVIGSDGTIKYAVSAAPFLPNKGVVECVTKALTKIYVGPPPAGTFGMIETLISFRPSPKP